MTFVEKRSQKSSTRVGMFLVVKNGYVGKKLPREVNL